MELLPGGVPLQVETSVPGVAATFQLTPPPFHLHALGKFTSVATLLPASMSYDTALPIPNFKDPARIETIPLRTALPQMPPSPVGEAQPPL